ncbi:MAG TPA: hypothetical protein VMR50_03570 [Myxococcota bacterium]|nr:hypothetical protein [Myxococcota bacterium]
MKDEILARIERALGVTGLAERLATRIQQADLHSLLLEVFRRRVVERTPAELLKDWASNRFVRPSTAEPAALARFDVAAYGALPAGFEALELAPVTPLGTSSVLATVHPDKALASIRSVEVLSDATNVLALECAARRKKNPTAPVHLAASHRHLRTPLFQGPLSFAHFRLFVLCSAGRDPRFHETALVTHLEFYARVARTALGAHVPIRISLTDLRGDPPRDFARDPGPEQVEVVFDQSRATGRGYYTDWCFKIHARHEGEWLELGDGGAVDWAQKLLSNAKERLVISGISSERICAIAGP